MMTKLLRAAGLSGIMFLSLCGGALAATMRGQVTDSATGLPVEGAAVVLTNNSAAFRTESDPFGYYTVGGIAAGAYTTVVSHAGYFPVVETNGFGPSDDLHKNFFLASALGGEGAGFDILVQVTDAGSGVRLKDVPVTVLRPGGGFGFIVSDTFFTLASKLRMREMLQDHRLDVIGQCDPFDATVDAAIFVARKCDVGQTAGLPDADEPSAPQPLLFVQARPRKRADGKTTEPEKFLPSLPAPADVKFAAEADGVKHGVHGDLRVHSVPADLYRRSHKRVFFEPRPATLQLHALFNDRVKELVAEWWEKIEDSRKFAANYSEISAYHKTLKPGDVTLVGLIAEGGQGLATANNMRFLGYLEGTPQAEILLRKRAEWTARWLADPEIAPVFAKLLAEKGGDAAHATRDGAAWEAVVEPLRAQFNAARLGFGKTDLYRVVPKGLVADENDLVFAWQERKKELLKHWRTEKRIGGFWQQLEIGAKKSGRPAAGEDLTDAEFCALCQKLQKWLAAENTKRKSKIPRDVLGLRSSEDYTDPDDAPRIATIYNGLCGRA